MANRKIPVVYRKKQEEAHLEKALTIIGRRKFILITSILAVVAIAFAYNFFATPTYESTVVLKKEKEEKNYNPDELSKIISLKNTDEIETEIALVKTTDVLDKTIQKLGLFLKINSIETGTGVINSGQSLVDYRHKYIEKAKNAGKYPQFTNVHLDHSDQKYQLMIVKNKKNTYDLYNAANDSLIERQAVKDSNVAEFHFENFSTAFYWPDAAEGSKIFFDVNSYYSTLKALKANISVEQKAKTDVFQITVNSKSSYSAAAIANEITNNFREARIDQQKQTIHYSFNFVDKNLDEITSKLEDAEKKLSDYKSSHKLMTIDASSQDLVQFISNLEAEKMKTQLELTTYENKYEDMKKELKSKGYFDQTYLTPQGTDQNNSPFTTLLRQLSDLELKRLDLLQKRTENHPEVVNIDNQISQIKNKLTNYNNNTLTSYKIITNTLQKKLDKMNSMLAKYNNKMSVLPGQENKLAGLLRQKDVYAKMYTLLLDKREEMRMAELSKLQDIVVVDSAHVPLEPITPRKKFNLAAGLIIGTLIGIFAIFVLEYRRKKLVNLDDLEQDFHLPIFAIIPSYSKNLWNRVKNAKDYANRFVALMGDQEGFVESYRILKTKLSIFFGNRKKTLMFTSSEENTGKTTIVANLAISLAKSRNKILVIDCDLKKGTLSTLFDIPNDAPGLIDYLMNKSESPYIYNKVVDTLDILPAGGVSDDSADLLSSERMKKLFNMINTSEYDYIIFDTPPVTRVVDTLILGKLVKDAVLILRPEHSFKDSVEWGIHELHDANINIIGSVINAAVIEKSNFKYRYGYGYGYKLNSTALVQSN